MPGQPFEVEYLRPLLAQHLKQRCLRAPCLTVDKHQVERGTSCIKAGDDCASPGLVSAFQHGDWPAHSRQDRRHGVRAHSPAPAIDQWSKAFGFVCKGGLQVMSRIPRHQRRAGATRLERRDLHIGRADLGPFTIVQHGKVDSARQVIQREFGRGAHINDHVMALKPRCTDIGQGLVTYHARLIVPFKPESNLDGCDPCLTPLPLLRHP